MSNNISGFGAGDTIALDGVSEDKDVYSPNEDNSGGTLKIKYHGEVVDTLNFLGSYNLSNFRYTPTASGTDVTFKPSTGSAASLDEQIFNSALLSEHACISRAGRHRRARLGDRKRDAPDLWSVGHAPGG